MPTLPKRDRFIEAATTLFYHQGLDFIMSLQGAFLISSCFRMPDMLERKLQRMEACVRSL